MNNLITGTFCNIMLKPWVQNQKNNIYGQPKRMPVYKFILMMFDASIPILSIFFNADQSL